MSTVPGTLAVQVPDQGFTVAASQTNVANGANYASKGTATDVVIVLSPTAVTGTVSAVVQGSNATSFASPTTVVPDKANSGATVNATTGVVTIPAASTAPIVLHLAQLQYQFYRLVVTTAATSGVTLTDAYVFVPVQDTFNATVA